MTGSSSTAPDFTPSLSIVRSLMALRASNPDLQWAALVLQIICALPHVRHALSEWGKDLPADILEQPYVDYPCRSLPQPTALTSGTQSTGLDETALLILQMCVRMKGSNVQEYVVDELLAALQVNPLNPGTPPGDASKGSVFDHPHRAVLTTCPTELYAKLTTSIETLLLKESEKQDKLRR